MLVTMGEWFNPPALGAGPKGRGFESHWLQIFLILFAEIFGLTQNQFK